MYKGICWVSGNLRVDVVVGAGALVTDGQCRG